MENIKVVQIRRDMLNKWIEDNFTGKFKQAQFLEDIATRYPDEAMNQGELSGLLSGKKSFGEKKARKIERLAKMPDEYLSNVQKKVIKRLTDPDALAKHLIAIYNALTDANKHKLLIAANELINSQNGDTPTEYNPFPIKTLEKQ
jgi:c-di-GMP-related signal transduction protein